MQGKVKITVIATGFDRPSAMVVSPSAAQTPVDLQNYSSWKQNLASESPWQDRG
jgi:hypothetical protein